MATTIWQALKNDWLIKKYQIKDLDIDPNKEAGTITLDELSRLANFLDVLEADIIEHYSY
jgi:hypothetical protein